MSKEQASKEQVELDKISGENMSWVYKADEGKLVHETEVAAELKSGWKATPPKAKD